MPNGAYGADYKDLWSHRTSMMPPSYFPQTIEYLAQTYPYYAHPSLPPQVYAEYMQHYQQSFAYAHEARGVALP